MLTRTLCSSLGSRLCLYVFDTWSVAARLRYTTALHEPLSNTVLGILKYFPPKSDCDPFSKLEWVRFVISQDFSQISGFYTNLPLPQQFLERREVATKERKTCIVSKPPVSYLCGCGESVNPPKLNIQEVQGALSSRPKGDPGLLHIFQDFLVLIKSHPWWMQTNLNAFSLFSR